MKSKLFVKVEVKIIEVTYGCKADAKNLFKQKKNGELHFFP